MYAIIMLSEYCMPRIPCEHVSFSTPNVITDFNSWRFEVFTEVKIQVEFFWFVIPCSIVAEDLAASYHNTALRHNPADPCLSLTVAVNESLL